MRSMPGASIRLRFLVLLAAVFIPGAAVFHVVVARNSGATLRRDARRLVAGSADVMRAVHREQVERDRRLMMEMASRLSSAGAREVSDIPFELFAGDERALKNEIRGRLDDLTRRSEATADALASMMLEDARRRIDGESAELLRRHEVAAEAFAASLSRRTVWIGSLLLLALAAVLLLGIWILVLRPLRAFSRVLSAPRSDGAPARVVLESRDEFGRLAAQFNAMADRIAASHGRLASEVREKTGALERATAELVHAEKMASLGRLAGGIAHEFNNLLGGISGCAEEALETAPEGPIRESLDVIRRTSRRASVVTANLLTFSRAEPRPVSPLDARAVLAEAVSLVMPEARAKDVSVDVEPGGGDCRVMAHGGELQQLVLNLLINAVRAVERGGRVRATVERSDGGVRLGVVDDGPGVPAEIRDRIFEPFFTTREKAGGSGLGLAVVHGIALGLGGSVRVGEAPGGGASFTVELPAAPARGPTAEKGG